MAQKSGEAHPFRPLKLFWRSLLGWEERTPVEKSIVERWVAFKQSGGEDLLTQSGFSGNGNILIDKTGIFTDSKDRVTTAFEVRRLVIYWAEQIPSGSKQLGSEWVAGHSIALSECYLHKFLTCQEQRQPQCALWQVEPAEYLNRRLTVLLSLGNNDTSGSGLRAWRLVQSVPQCCDVMKTKACYRR